MEQRSSYCGIEVQSPSKSIDIFPAIPALPAIPLSEVEYSSSSTYSQKLLHSIYYSSVLPLLIPKSCRKECGLKSVKKLSILFDEKYTGLQNLSKFYIKLSQYLFSYFVLNSINLFISKCFLHGSVGNSIALAGFLCFRVGKLIDKFHLNRERTKVLGKLWNKQIQLSIDEALLSLFRSVNLRNLIKILSHGEKVYTTQQP